jgi:8-oxo-dGTP pyrophosphatase MutT (NUDIX family)
MDLQISFDVTDARRNSCKLKRMVAIVDLHTARSLFHHALPASRLGKEHATLEEFRRHVQPRQRQYQERTTEPVSDATPVAHTKEYTLIVVTECNTQRILLGQKHRGFGHGMYNSFGGKVEIGETISASAVRELYEETGIPIADESTMSQCRIGTLHFTFEDNATEMIVHLFRINIQVGNIHRHRNNEDRKNVVTTENSASQLCPIIHIDSMSIIRGCEEITPIWLDDWTQIPLDHMFADDSIWLTHLLSTSASSKTTIMRLDGWFHFRAGGQETNTILHYHVQDTSVLLVPHPYLEVLN